MVKPQRHWSPNLWTSTSLKIWASRGLPISNHLAQLDSAFSSFSSVWPKLVECDVFPHYGAVSPFFQQRYRFPSRKRNRSGDFWYLASEPCFLLPTSARSHYTFIFATCPRYFKGSRKVYPRQLMKLMISYLYEVMYSCVSSEVGYQRWRSTPFCTTLAAAVTKNSTSSIGYSSVRLPQFCTGISTSFWRKEAVRELEQSSNALEG